MTLGQLRQGVAHLFIFAGIAALFVGFGVGIYAVHHFRQASFQGGVVEQAQFYRHWDNVSTVWIAGGIVGMFAGLALHNGIPPSVRRGWRFCRRKFTRAILRVGGTSLASRSHYRLAIYAIKVAVVCTIAISVTEKLFAFSERQANILAFAIAGIGMSFYSVRIYRVLRRIRQ